MLSKPFHLKHALLGTIYPDMKAHQNPPMANTFFAQIQNGRHRDRREIQMRLISQQNNLETHMRCHLRLI